MNLRRLGSIVLVLCSLFLLSLSPGVYQVRATTAPLSNPSVPQCSGSGCGGGGGGSCDPTDPFNWMEYHETWTVTIDSISPKGARYHPGDTVPVNGHVTLSVVVTYVNICTGSLWDEEYDGTEEASSVSIKIADKASTMADADGYFSAKATLSPTENAGPHTYSVTASFPGTEYSSGPVSARADATFTVDPFAPTLVVQMSQGGFVYPGDTAIVSGTGWAPNTQITLQCAVPGGKDQTPTADSKGSFTSSPIVVPSDSDEKSYPVSATQTKSGLTQSGEIIVKWRPLKLVVTQPPDTWQGSSCSIDGTVTDPSNNEGPVDASIDFEITYSSPTPYPVSSPTQFLPEMATPRTPSPVTASGGQFHTSIAVPGNAFIGEYTISLKAQKKGYKTMSAHVVMNIYERPPGWIPDIPQIAAPIAGGAAGGALAMPRKKRVGWDSDGVAVDDVPDTRKLDPRPGWAGPEQPHTPEEQRPPQVPAP